MSLRNLLSNFFPCIYFPSARYYLHHFSFLLLRITQTAPNIGALSQKTNVKLGRYLLNLSRHPSTQIYPAVAQFLSKAFIVTPQFTFDDCPSLANPSFVAAEAVCRSPRVLMLPNIVATNVGRLGTRVCDQVNNKKWHPLNFPESE